MTIRLMLESDIPHIVALWNQAVIAGDIISAPLTEAVLKAKFMAGDSFYPALNLVSVSGDRLHGFVSATVKSRFLPGESFSSTPGYLTCLLVAPESRGQGIGTAMLQQVVRQLKTMGKTSINVSGDNPVKIDWLVPGTPGHDHNNQPGCDVACAGHGFLLKNGFIERHREVAMYLNLSRYVSPEDLNYRRQQLKADGILTGRYDVSLGYDYDRMCDRVPSEYWREVLRTETRASNPRVILAATIPGYIVGFTGPVDRQASGRGWFTGICTDPVFGGRGIATVLFNLLMQEFIGIGASFSTLFTGVDNHARKIYERAGFTAVREFAVMTKDI